MKVIKTPLEGVLIFEPRIFKDKRGFFMETYRQDRYETAGVTRPFVQDNMSCSVQRTLRGLHFQVRHPQAKLVQVISGQIFDVAVDIRPSSSTFGQWTGAYLTDRNRCQLFMPEGFAHGFLVLSKTALFSYKCSDYYHPGDEGGILWSDPEIGIDWPIKDVIVSEKDKKLRYLSDLSSEQLYVKDEI